MNTRLAGKIHGGQPATFKRREKLRALGGIGAGRAAAKRSNAALLQGRVLTTTL
jgi:hypothetical protein